MIFRHYKTAERYRFLHLAVEERTQTVVVVYEHVEDGTVWTRPAEEFFGQVRTLRGDAALANTNVEEFVPRFKLELSKRSGM